jgi:hypothetical protein
MKAEAIFLEGHQVVFELWRMFQKHQWRLNGEPLVQWSRLPSLASRHTQSLRQRMEGKLYCCSALSNSWVFACLSHLLTDVGVFFIVFFSHIYSLCYYCYYWIKIGFWIDDRIVKLKFMKDRWDRCLKRFDKGRNLVSQWYIRCLYGLDMGWCVPWLVFPSLYIRVFSPQYR